MQRSAYCRSRRELSNEYFFAKFGFDTAEITRPLKLSVSMRVGTARPRLNAFKSLMGVTRLYAASRSFPPSTDRMDVRIKDTNE